MKKLISLALVMVLVFSFVGCASKSSGLTINALQKTLQSSDSELVFQKTQTAKGYSFQYTNKNSVTDIAYSGEADSEENVFSFKIVNSNVETTKLKNADELSKILKKSSGSMTRDDLRIGYCCMQIVTLRQAFGATDSDIPVQEIADLFAGNRSSMSVGDWTIKARIEGTGTVVITATFS